jgi:hypothetical protein
MERDEDSLAALVHIHHGIQQSIDTRWARQSPAWHRRDRKIVHLILDNYAAHKYPKVRQWLDRHPRFTYSRNIYFFVMHPRNVSRIQIILQLCFASWTAAAALPRNYAIFHHKRAYTRPVAINLRRAVIACQ